MKTIELVNRLVAGLPDGPVCRGQADLILRRSVKGVTSMQVASAVALATARGQIERKMGGTVIMKCSMTRERS